MFAQHQRELFVGFFGEQLVACKNPSNVAQLLSLENELHSSICDGGICDREEKKIRDWRNPVSDFLPVP